VKTSSAKAKGQRLARSAKDILLKKYPALEEDDIRVTPSGVPGEDLGLSPLARKYFPFSIECKNQESLNIWKAYEQASSNCKGHKALLIFKRNHSETMVALTLEDFLDLV